jgi:hypothetical protein
MQVRRLSLMGHPRSVDPTRPSRSPRHPYSVEVLSVAVVDCALPLQLRPTYPPPGVFSTGCSWGASPLRLAEELGTWPVVVRARQ